MRYKIEEHTNGYGESKYQVFKEYGPEGGKYWTECMRTIPGKPERGEVLAIFRSKEHAENYIDGCIKSVFNVTNEWVYGE